MTKGLAVVVSMVSLFLCLLSPLLRFQGVIDESTYKQIFMGASIGWFIAATTWATRRG
jgi:hypothetical protein